MESLNNLIRINLKRNGDKEMGMKRLADVNTRSSFLDLEPVYNANFTFFTHAYFF